MEFKFTDLGTQKIKNTVLHAYDVVIEGLEQRALGSSIKSSEITVFPSSPTVGFRGVGGGIIPAKADTFPPNRPSPIYIQNPNVFGLVH